MNAPLTTELQGEAITFKLNGVDVTGLSSETIIETAKRNGVEIPRLCYKPGYRPDGNCRACMVEIKGERVLAPACCRYPKAGMEVTKSEVLLPNGALRQTGEYDVVVRVHSDIEATIKLAVVPE